MGPDVIVIGGGPIGSSIAYTLARSGARVVLCDRGAPDGRAWEASAGVLLPISDVALPGPLIDLWLESHRLFPALAEELRERTGLDIGYRASGLLRVALGEREERELRNQRMTPAGAEGVWLDPGRVREVEPALTSHQRGAVLYPQGHQVSAPSLVRALQVAAANLGTEVRPGSIVDGVVIEGDRVTGVRIGAELLRAGEVVLANGAWAASWGEALRTPIPVMPVRGQIVGVQTGRTALRHMVHAGPVYLATKAEGVTLVGATVEEVGFDPRPTVAGIAELLAQLAQVAPGLADATFVGAWAGLRPDTPDHLPIIGRIPGWHGVTIAAGHFRNGVLLAPITGELVTDLIRNRRTRLALDAFASTRFTMRVA